MDSLFCYHLVLLCVAALAFCLLWIGFLTPGWIALTVQEQQAASEYTVSSMNRSLFYDVFCPQELESCKTCTHNDYTKCITEMAFPNQAPDYTNHLTWFESIVSGEEEWTLWQVITTIVVICSFFGFIFVIVLVCCLLKTWVYRTVAIGGFILWIIAGILVWVPVGMVAHLHLEHKETVDNNVPHDSTLHIPYSIIILAMGGLLAFITALMLLWLTGVCGSSSDRSSTESESQILSDRTKTQRRTVVHNEYGGGYYGPYPYEYYERQPEYRTNYVYRDTRGPKTDTSSTTEDEFYVVDSPYYPGYNGYFEDGRRVYDNRNIKRLAE